MNDVSRPRYASYLPAVYLKEPESSESGAQGALASLVALFEALMSGMESMPRRELEGGREKLPGLEQILDGIGRYSDPLAAPARAEAEGISDQGFFDDDFLPFLASWLALTLRQHWSEAKRRRLIQNIVPLYKKRGTVEGITRFLEVFVEYPIQVTEWLGIQIGRRSTVGVDTTVGVPHMFLVEIAYGERKSEEPQPFDFAYLRQVTHNTREILDLEKPAHTDYRALYRFPGVIVGEDSTVGLATLLWPGSGAAVAIHSGG